VKSYRYFHEVAEGKRKVRKRKPSSLSQPNNTIEDDYAYEDENEDDENEKDIQIEPRDEEDEDEEDGVQLERENDELGCSDILKSGPVHELLESSQTQKKHRNQSQAFSQTQSQTQAQSFSQFLLSQHNPSQILGVDDSSDDQLTIL